MFLAVSPPPIASPSAPWSEIGGQITGIDQQEFPFRSPYAGPHSFLSSDQNALSHTYTLYLGVRPIDGLEFYLDPEMALGYGLSNAEGLAGLPNGDVIRGPGGGGIQPYIARAFARCDLPLGLQRVLQQAGENQIPGPEATSRLRLTAGKLSTTDLFDTNSYANSTRTQFENWALINDAAYDYAADTHGYSLGAAIEWIHPSWTLRAGSFMMPTVANGPTLDPDLANARGDQIELELDPEVLEAGPTVVRVMAYMNHADMGNYAQAIAEAAAGQAPDVTTTRHVGAIKYGVGLNLEQPLADDGQTGLFARLGWNDGNTESFAYTEADRALSLGAQISGARWDRADDRLGLALAVNGLSPSHAAYLARGGLGFVLGDGKLDYNLETIVEAYYDWHVWGPFTAGLDDQWIANPGYNADRGPVSVLSARMHVEL